MHDDDFGEINCPEKEKALVGTTAPATVVSSAATADDQDAHLTGSEGDHVKGGRDGGVGHHDARRLFAFFVFFIVIFVCLLLGTCSSSSCRMK